MQIPYILTVFAVFLLLVTPVSANLNKISANSPVFIGENNVDISAALNGCHSIGWWANGSDINKDAPAKTSEIYPINTVSSLIYHYNISRDLYGGSTGTWYCVDQKTPVPVFTVEEPWIDIKIWDLDHNADITGKTVSLGTNITYRIDTNLYQTLVLKNRPDRNLDDSPFTVKLIDPRGKSVGSIYTGSMGKPNTVILPFESKPYVTTSPYYWRDGANWDHRAKNQQGDTLYPDGTYSFVLSQNLNNMQESYRLASDSDRDGKITKTSLVAFAKDQFVATVTESATTVQTPESTVIPRTTDVTTAPEPVTTAVTSSPIPKRTTYSPLPEWLAVAGLAVAGFALVAKRP